jgi:hypothetical protein
MAFGFLGTLWHRRTAQVPKPTSEAPKKLTKNELEEVRAPLLRHIEELEAENLALREKLVFSGLWIL